MKKIATYLVFCLLVGSAIFLYGFSTKKNNAKKVHKVSIQFAENDHQFLTKKMVNKLLIQNRETIENQPKSVIDLQGLEQVIVSSPYVEEVVVFLTIDGALNVYVKQRSPIARVLFKGGAYYIDKQGVEVPISTNYSSRVLLVNGNFNSEELKNITKFINALLADEFLKKEIVGVSKNSKNEFELSVRSGKHKIEFGKLEEVQVKFKKIKAFYNATFSDKTIESYKRVNVTYHNQIVCTKI